MLERLKAFLFKLSMFQVRNTVSCKREWVSAEGADLSKDASLNDCSWMHRSKQRSHCGCHFQLLVRHITWWTWCRAEVAQIWDWKQCTGYFLLSWRGGLQKCCWWLQLQWDTLSRRGDARKKELGGHHGWDSITLKGCWNKEITFLLRKKNKQILRKLKRSLSQQETF